MADEIIKVLEYILNNETLRTIGTAYFVYVAIVFVIALVMFAINLKSILSTRKVMRDFRKNFRKW